MNNKDQFNKQVVFVSSQKIQCQNKMDAMPVSSTEGLIETGVSSGGWLGGAKGL